jgi:hypothetical protein
MAARKGNKVALKAKKPKKTRQGNGTHSKFPTARSIEVKESEY